MTQKLASLRLAGIIEAKILPGSWMNDGTVYVVELTGRELTSLSSAVDAAKRASRAKIILSDRSKPTCGREDCDRAENPTHWVDADLNPAAKAKGKGGKP